MQALRGASEQNPDFGLTRSQHFLLDVAAPSTLNAETSLPLAHWLERRSGRQQSCRREIRFK